MAARRRARWPSWPAARRSPARAWRRRREASAGRVDRAALARPHNNFALLRLALALAVVVSHAFSVTTGEVQDEPLARLTGFTLGEHAVNGFFAISGFLVTMSFDRRGWRDYAVARTLRIAPALDRRDARRRASPRRRA